MKSKRIVPVLKAAPPIKRSPEAMMVPLADFGPVPQFILSPGSKSDAPRVEGCRVVAAWDISHSDQVRDRFAEVCTLLGNVQTLYHGTSAQNIQNIATEGLRPGRKECMFGSGIYMGKINKALGYTSGTARYIIKVQVALGKVLEAERSHSYNRQKLVNLGYDSVMGVAGSTLSLGGILVRSEWVVYSPEQVLALKVYEYQNEYIRSPQDVEKTCVVMVEKDVPLPKGSSAFQDILRKKPCGERAYTWLKTDDGDVWVCANCVDRLRLKIGSKVEVKSVSAYDKYPTRWVRIIHAHYQK